MSPIRVALVGLSANDTKVTAVGNWGILAHLKPILASPHYELAAVCNSSVESAQRSIAFHELPSTVKAYGSVEALAADPDIDLVAISVNVAKHYQLTKPALLGKKDVLVEWPLGATIDESRELARLAREQGVRAVLGLQMRSDPLVAKVKELLRDGHVGTVTSSAAWGCTSALPSGYWIEEATYYLDMKSGGNPFYIFFGHFLDTFTSVLGGFKTLQSTLKTLQPTVPLINTKTGQQGDPAYPRTAPDHMLVQGELSSGAVASLSFRNAKAPVDGLGLRWLITGTKGEIEVTLPEDHLQMGPAGRAIRLRNYKDDEVRVVDFEEEEEPAYVGSVPHPGTNTARLYEAFATGSGRLADFEQGLETHELLDKIAKAAQFI